MRSQTWKLPKWAVCVFVINTTAIYSLEHGCSAYADSALYHPLDGKTSVYIAIVGGHTAWAGWLGVRVDSGSRLVVFYSH